MDKLICNHCDLHHDIDISFCTGCGNKILCDNCRGIIHKNASFCGSCGTAVNKKESGTTLNTIKFKETKDERSYEVAFTNDATKDVSSVLINMLGSKGIGLSENTLKPEIVDKVENENLNDTIENKTIDVQGEVISEKSINDNFKNTADDSFHKYHKDELEIKLKDNGISETEWLLIYAFYNSEFGKKTFTKNDLVSYYLSKRSTTSRKNNMDRTWKKTFYKYFSVISEGNYIINSEGSSHVVKLLNGDVSYKVPKKAITKKRVESDSVSTSTKKNTSSPNIKVEEFEAINKNGNLIDFFDRIAPSTTPDKILTIAYFIQKIQGKMFFTDGNIDYAYKFLKIDRINHLRQVITNIKGKELWFTLGEQPKTWSITRKGELYFEQELNNNK